MPRRFAVVTVAALALAGSVAPAFAQAGVSAQAPGDGWVALFNGEDLTGWIPKITGYDLGEDPMATFRVEDGLLAVGYEQYDEFRGRFGHIFFAERFAAYELRIEYRFVGEQVAGGPGWALRNSGVMFHAQSPESMLRGQDFPISIEAQFLGGDGTGPRPTANLCTPGTHVEMLGALIERHCVAADGPTIDGDAWVMFELIVRGDSVVHMVDADTVLAYERPVIGGGNVSGHDPAVKRDGEPLTGGWIALQSESHPIQFRGVWIRKLPADRQPSW